MLNSDTCVCYTNTSYLSWVVDGYETIDIGKALMPISEYAGDIALHMQEHGSQPS
jgi:hypothetical protein